jgi:hypothetical protein
MWLLEEYRASNRAAIRIADSAIRIPNRGAYTLVIYIYVNIPQLYVTITSMHMV